MQKEGKLIPFLRFKEFNDKWITKKLGDISISKRGKNILKVNLDDNGINKCILYGELFTKYKSIINNIFFKNKFIWIL